MHGIGGDNLKNAGATIFCDHSKMSGFGLNFKMIVEHLGLEKDVCEYILDEYKPDVVLLIDYGTFNLRVAKRLKGSGIKVFHYIPPQVWASRKWRIKGIKKYVDKVLCIFPFEVEMYEKEGIPVHYCGHPLVKQLPEKADRKEFFEKHGFDNNRPLVSVFPGSRPLELAFLADTFIKSIKKLQKKHPELQFCISHASNLKDDIFNKYKKLLDAKNYNFTSCCTPTSIFDLIEISPIDVVIIDEVTENLNLLLTIKRIKSKQDNAQILLLSNGEQIDEEVSKFVNGYILKNYHSCATLLAWDLRWTAV